MLLRSTCIEKSSTATSPPNTTEMFCTSSTTSATTKSLQSKTPTKCREDTFRRVHHEQHQNCAVNNFLERQSLTQQLGEQSEHDRSADCPGDRTHAPDYHHGEHQNSRLKTEAFRVDE